jgi:hypothetical protein
MYTGWLSHHGHALMYSNQKPLQLFHDLCSYVRNCCSDSLFVVEGAFENDARKIKNQSIYLNWRTEIMSAIFIV